MKKIILALLALGVLLASQKEFVVGVENIKYLPYYSCKNGEYIGASREILDAFAKSKGYKFVYKPLPIKRLYASFLQKQNIDFKYPDDPNWKSNLKTNLKIFYSNGLLTYIDGTIVKKENKKKGIKTLGTVSGFTPWDYLDLINSNKIKLKENRNLRSLLMNTKKGFIDGAYVNVEVAKYACEKLRFKTNSLAFDESLPFTKSTYKLSTIKHPKIIQEFSRFLKQHKRLVDRIKKKYQIRLK